MLDLIPLRNIRHTAANLALAIASRIDSHTHEEQFFYGATTDNAKNVVAAAKMLVLQYETILENENKPK